MTFRTFPINTIYKKTFIMQTDNHQEPVRVLMLFTILNRGGAETMVMNYYRNIDRTKLQFDFIVHRQERGAYEDEIEALGGHVYRLMPLHPLTFHQYKKQVSRFFDEHPDYKIIHGQCSESGYFIYKEAARRGVPVIIAHAHNSHVPFDLKLIMRTYFKHRMRPYLSHGFSCGREAAEWLFGKKMGQKAILLNNAIDTRRYAFSDTLRQNKREELGLKESTLAVLHVGSFAKAKNHKFIIDVFHQLHSHRPDSVLLLAGAGPMRQDIEDKVKRLGLTDSVRFLGSRDDIPELMMAADTLLFPSIFEGLPVTLIEAQATGLNCLISDRIPQEVVVTGKVQVMSLSQDAAQWAEKTSELALDKSERMSCLQNIINAGYDVRKNAQWLQDFYLSQALQ